MTDLKYNARAVERKWQSYWKDRNVFSPLEKTDRPPFYVLEMFPYPSGTLHMGHARNYTIGDVLARYRWAQGYEVLHPMGWDACGLPAENAALQKGVHPKEWTYRNAEVMKEQCQRMGFSHDWSREFFSCDPTYFKHEQKMFLDFYAKGLAYRKKSYVNWDPVDQSVLANEQVIEGRGWRSGAIVEKKLLNQWFLKITDFAQELLDDLEGLDHWPESVKQMQVNWIGRSEGAIISFQVDCGEVLKVFSTRSETLYGATFCAIAFDHPLTQQWAPSTPDLAEFAQECQRKGTAAQVIETEEKKGVFTGHYAAHPLLQGQRLPIYAVNYVMSDYGTGAVFGCPAHDQRDFEFARAYHLPIIPVIKPDHKEVNFCVDKAYTGAGTMMNSHNLDGLSLEEARQKMMFLLMEKGTGKKELVYRLRDWGIGRQRYWGVPIPMIYCPCCGVVPVPEKDLPVTLPEDVTFDQPGNPLQRHPSWKHVDCPRCGQKAERETDTFDTFFESSWYFSRFCDPHNTEQAFSKEKAHRWLPVNQYIGGIEHAVLHLLYARFFTKALKMCGYWDLSEPFKGLFTQGMVCHKTFRAHDGTWLLPEEVDIQKEISLADGTPVEIGRSEKMSKSKCNVVGVSTMVDTYGADAVRLFLLSDTPPSKDLEWTDEGIEGAWRYIRRIWTLFAQKIPLIGSALQENKKIEPLDLSPAGMTLMKKVHQSVALITQALENYSLNKYIAFLRECSNEMAGFTPQGESDQWALCQALRIFVQLMAPAMPHLAEEIGGQLGFEPGLHQHPWPVAEAVFLKEDSVVIAVQINGKTRGTVSVSPGMSEEDLKAHLKTVPSLEKYLEGTWEKCIFVPGRMISLVVR